MIDDAAAHVPGPRVGTPEDGPAPRAGDPAFYAAAHGRNLGILTEEEQHRLERATIAVAGLGGIGGSTVVALARMGVGRFRLADFDRFEVANINRQYGAFADTVGRPKCEVVAEEVRRINPRAEVEIVPEGFVEDTAPDTAGTGDRLLRGADLAVDAIDFYRVETHLAFHRKTREHGLYTLMGSPIGFSACLQVFDPHGMSIEEYCGIDDGMDPLEKQLRYACGLVPTLAHIDYYDVSAPGSGTDFSAGAGPSLAAACGLASSLVATEAVLLLLGRRRPRPVPHTTQFDPYTYRYDQTYTPGGMRNFDPAPLLDRLADRSSLVPQVLDFLYGKPQAHRAAVNGVELYHREDGERTEAPPLVLVSPLGNDSSFWARQVGALADERRVVTYDARGTGVSTPWPRETSIEMLADDLVALIEKLGVGPCHVAGLAIGGLVAARVAAQHPDLVRGVVLASCYAAPDATIRRVTEEWRRLAEQGGVASMEDVYEACQEWVFTPEYVRDNQEEMNRLKTFFRLTVQDPASFVQQSLAGVRYDAGPDLARVRCPALVLHGGADRLAVPERARELAAALPDARLTVVEGAAHFLTWEHADRFNKEVRHFLNSVEKNHEIAGD